MAIFSVQKRKKKAKICLMSEIMFNFALELWRHP